MRRPATRTAPPRRILVVVGTAVALVLAGALVAGRGDDRPVVELPPGRHDGFRVDEPTIVRAAPGAVVTGPIEIRSDRVRLEDVVVEGTFEFGISVRDARAVELERVTVRGPTFGIDANVSVVTIRDCEVTGIPTDAGRAIVVRNALGQGRSRVEGCRVDGGREGIVSHVNRIEFRDNVVTGTTMRGITVTEMSEGLVERNTVHDVMGAAIFCGDMSHCEIRGNDVSAVAADPHGIRMRSGQAVVSWYYSTVRVRDNDFRVDHAVPVDVYRGSVEVDRFPLSLWPPGWRDGGVPWLWVTLVSVAALVVVRALVTPGVRWLARRAAGPGASAAPARGDPPPARPGRWRLGMTVLVATGVVQVLHVAEHGVQVFQFYVAHAESRQGLAGEHFNTEWLHLGFNALVGAGLLVGLALAGRELLIHHRRAATWLVAAAVVQTWHVVEHVARVRQFLDTGISPAPGVIGHHFGLVWFHYGINVTVTAGLVVAGVLVGRARRTPPQPPGPEPVPAGTRELVPV